MKRSLGLGAISSLVLLAASCGEAVPACADVDLACSPLYPPTYENVYTTTLAAKCGADRGACHSNAGRGGGLSLADRQASHAELVEGKRVEAGNPSCSEMIVRVHGVGTGYQMPPGDPLTAAERCALAQWVAAGAPGPTEAQ